MARLGSALALGAVLTFCASADLGVAPTKNVPPNTGNEGVVAAVQIILPRHSLEVGDSIVAQARVLDANGVAILGRAVVWSSANPEIAQISGQAVITAVSVGQTTISATVDSIATSGEIETYAPVSQPAPPELPRVFLDTRYVAPVGRVRSVRAGDDLQQAIDDAQRGDVVALEAGAVFTGNFVLTEKPGTGWIVIRTAALDSALPPEGTRIRPDVHGPALAVLQTADPSRSVITTAPRASGYRLIGLEITARSDVVSLNTLVRFGEGGPGQSTVESVPSDLVLDRSYIHGHDGLNLQRCLALNSASSAVIDSHLSECHAKGSDSQAIIGWNGPGPFKIMNNYLEGAGENVMFGGADPRLPDLMPADIEIRGNHFYKPISWKGRWTVKNLFELKLGRRILVEGNVFEHCWVDAQTGVAISFKSVNQGGTAPWSQTSDVTVRYNLVRRAAAGLTIAGERAPALPIARVLIEHNVFDEIGAFAGTQNGRMIMLMNEVRDVEIRHNTLLHNAEAGAFLLFADAGPARGFVVRDNIATKGGPFGAVKGTAVPQGAQSLAAFAGTYTFAKNVVIGLPNNFIRMYPTNNFYVGSLDGVGLADVATGDYRLTSSSPYYGAGTGGSNPGADWGGVVQRVRAAVLTP